MCIAAAIAGRRAVMAVGAALGLALAASADGVSTGTLELVIPDGLSAHAQFGLQLEIDDLLLAVGAPHDVYDGESTGSVYIFRLQSDLRWQQLQKLTALDACGFDEFGKSLDLSGDLLLVGAPEGVFLDSDQRGNPLPNTGSAYLFRREAGNTNGWIQIDKLLAADGEIGDEFGHAVAVSGETALVGARFHDEAGGFSGSAYIFEAGGAASREWDQTQKIMASDAAANQCFGDAVAIDGDVIVVGAPDALFDAQAPGAVYVFTRSPLGWNETARLTGSSALTGDRFGAAVAVSGDTIAAAAFHTDRDTVYLYERVAGGFDWIETATLRAPCDVTDSDFGSAIALHENLLIVGAPFDDEAAGNSGAAFIYEKNTGGPGQWGFVAKIFSSDSAPLDQFGLAVAVSYDAVVIGAPGHDAGGDGRGAAYAATLFLADSDLDGIPDIADNCVAVANGPDSLPEGGPPQRDTDADGFGNMCDADFNNDCMVNFSDLDAMRELFFTTGDDVDLNGDGRVDFADLALMTAQFFETPGPSAIADCGLSNSPQRTTGSSGLQIATELACDAADESAQADYVK